MTLTLTTVVTGVLGLWAVTQLSSARHHLEIAKISLSTARTSLAEGDGSGARKELDRAARELAAARGQADKFPLGRPFRAVPLLGSPSKAIVDVTRAGVEVVAAGMTLAEVSASLPTSATASLNGHDLAGLHASATEAAADLALAERHLRAAGRFLRGPSGAALPPVSRLASKLASEVKRGRQEVAGARRGLGVIASLTASGRETRLLLLSQDSLELRPTGGYVGSYGVLHFSAGNVTLERYDATENLPEPQPRLEPPRDLEPWLPRWWGLSNVNWWPDFPTTGQTAREMFKRQGGGDVDGVVAITELAIARLVGAMGPLQVPGYPEPVVEEGFERRSLYEVELKRPLDEPRKKFLIELANVVFGRLFDLPAGEFAGVARAVDASVGAGDIQIWFADPALQGVVQHSAWSGRLPAADRDFLMLVDANLSASKANLGVTKEVTYRVRRDGGDLLAHLEVVVRNEAAPEENLNPYYNGFLRVYVPRRSQLLTARPGQRDDGRADDGSYRVFSQALDVHPRAEQRVVFDYLLPDSVAPDGRYRLNWIRQAGTARDSLTAVVGRRIRQADPTQRSFVVSADLRPNPIVRFLRSRWIVRRLAGDAGADVGSSGAPPASVVPSGT
ncbi:MAG TPA: DUF4012 domain-containing protein [Acidimicrobiales bacterium]|nr:DUF4012 domain-containing protein [Acidimicrobiales bacterium]